MSHGIETLSEGIRTNKPRLFIQGNNKLLDLHRRIVQGENSDSQTSYIFSNNQIYRRYLNIFNGLVDCSGLENYNRNTQGVNGMKSDSIRRVHLATPVIGYWSGSEIVGGVQIQGDRLMPANSSKTFNWKNHVNPKTLILNVCNLEHARQYLILKPDEHYDFSEANGDLLLEYAEVLKGIYSNYRLQIGEYMKYQVTRPFEIVGHYVRKLIPS